MVQPTPHIERSFARRAGARRPLIRIVDACVDDYQVLLADESLADATFEFVTSGRAALRSALDDTPALWVINTQLPDMSGCDLCRMLHARGPATVYLVADQYRPQDERAAWIAGAAWFRAKPVRCEWFARFARPELALREQ